MISSKITVLLRNNSVQFIHEEPPSENAPCGLLLCLMVAGLCLNAFVLLSIALLPDRAKILNRLLACLSVAAVLENMTNVMSSIVIRSSWENLHQEFGELSVSLFCGFDASLLQFVAVFQSYVIAVLTYETSLSLRNGYGGIKFRTIVSFLVFVPLMSSIPIGFFSTRYVEQRYSCSPVYVSQPTQILIASAALLLGYFLPWSLMLNSYIAIIKGILKERRRIHVLELVARHRASAILDDRNAREMSLFTLNGVLVLFYIILVVPNVISIQVSQFYVNYHIKGEPAVLFEEFVANKTELPERLRTVETNAFDSICIWARYGFSVVSPGLIILFHKDIQKECRNVYASFGREEEFRNFNKMRRKGKEAVDSKTAVLFATSEGLHLRTREIRRFPEPKFVVNFCDLFREDHNRGKQEKLVRGWHSLDDCNGNSHS